MLLSDNHRPPVLEITGLTVHYGDHAALSDVTMTVSFLRVIFVQNWEEKSSHSSGKA